MKGTTATVSPGLIHDVGGSSVASSVTARSSLMYEARTPVSRLVQALFSRGSAVWSIATTCTMSISATAKHERHDWQ